MITIGALSPRLRYFTLDVLVKLQRWSLKRAASYKVAFFLAKSVVRVLLSILVPALTPLEDRFACLMIR
jgi:hypothetical protein